MYYLDLLKDMEGRENVVDELITEYFNKHLYSNPQLKNKGVIRGEYIYDVKDPRIAIGCSNELHVRDFNFYFDNRLEDDNVISRNKLWIGIVYSKLKQLSPTFAEDYMKRAIARNDDILDYVQLSKRKRIESKYNNMIARLVAKKNEELDAVDAMIIEDRKEFNSIFDEQTKD